MEEMKIKYSPILKEKIEFFGETSFGRRINIQKNSAKLSDNERLILSKMKVNNQYKFLQEVGTDFFESLHSAFFDTQDGQISLDLETTEDVYKEFGNMIEWYNKDVNEKNRFFLKELTNHLPSNEEVFQFIKQKVKELNTRLEGFDVNRLDAAIEELVNNSINNFTTKLKENDDSTISICITGVFSTGKSTVINALIGADILESDSDPTTAGVFSIKKISKSEPIKIVFDLIDKTCKETEIELSYSEKMGSFDFSGLPPTDFFNQLRDSIKEMPNDVDKQLKTIVSEINNIIKEQTKYEKSEEKAAKEGIPCSLSEPEFRIDNEIQIQYPFEIGGEVPIIIYDTPGSNSTYIGDKGKISSALENQKNSILITVLSPDKKGDKAGNDILFSAINNAENGNQYLDKSRILFVFNQIDGDNSDDEKISKYKHGSLTFDVIGEDKNGNPITTDSEIKLSDYHLYFLSAKKALAAQQLKKGIEDKKVTRTFDDTKIYSDLFKECSCGWETENIIKSGEEASASAINNKNVFDEALVQSGLFTLQTGITKYIQKYSTAIRAKSLYDIVSTVFSEIDVKLKALEENLETVKSEKIDEYNSEKNGLKDFVKTVCDENKSKLPLKLSEYNLQSSSEWVDQITKKIHKECNNTTYKGKCLGKFRLKSTNQAIEKEIVSNVNTFIKNHTSTSKKQLQDIIKDINDKIAEELHLRLANAIGENTFAEIYKSVTNSSIESLEMTYSGEGEQRLWLYNVSPDSFEEDLRKHVNESTATVRGAIDNFPKSMNEKIDAISSMYQENLDSLSKKLEAIKENINETNNQILAAQEIEKFVRTTKQDIDEKIWKKQ